jgi:chromosome segregation ATPase
MNTYEFDDNFLTIIKAKIEELKNTSLEEKEKKDKINEINELVDKANSWIEIERTTLDDKQEELEEELCDIQDERGQLKSLTNFLNEEIEEFKKITNIYKCNNTIDMFEGE